MSKPYLVTIQRTNPLGETIAIEVELDSREDIARQWAQKVTPSFHLLDKRLEEMNLRILAVTSKTMQLAPREFDIIRNILMMTTGFAPPAFEGVQAQAEAGGNMRAKQWVDDVSPRDEDGAKLSLVTR